MSTNLIDLPTILLLGDSITKFGDNDDGCATFLREYY